ncbi:mitotic-spindle organizing protein 1-like isoform X1 [Leptopilina heterotoma]|uniref:mitotic-spindle organizing protein 1-like isoform X1 n=2 Tax=Leptopilina heterotoma TaxID=63436 RepID=UPI001CA89DA6|nr:mitotic-spindle organizing protein 1-like isoform X1 [Leptopilina heterotoma]
MENIYNGERLAGNMPEPVHHQVNAARKTFQTLHQIAKLLNTNLDPATLSICVRLCENGVNPQALATIVKELQKEVKNLDATPDDFGLNKSPSFK